MYDFFNVNFDSNEFVDAMVSHTERMRELANTMESLRDKADDLFEEQIEAAEKKGDTILVLRLTAQRERYINEELKKLG